MDPVEEPIDADGGLLETGAAEKSEIQSRENLDRTAPIDEILLEERGQKRPADDDCDTEAGSDGDDANDDFSQDAGTETEKLSKNKLRKLKRRKMWEVKKQEKKGLRKEKRHKQQERKRLEREAEIAAAAAEGREPVFHEAAKRQPISATKVPVSVIIDCQFEQYMMEKELVSLGSQITRCYSDNRNAQFPVHMFISSYGGQMKERFETVLKNQHEHWKNVHFAQGDFVEAASDAKSLMEGPEGGQVIDLLSQGKEGDSVSMSETTNYTKKQQKQQKIAPVPEPEADDVDKSIVYLTADSPYTLDRLEPNTCYVIGGIIDKNREKGLCYKIARQRKVRTAKLPIGDFMVMQSRHVLTTNHVMEIMLRWLETGDWGTAFMKVIPTRKGGKLKEDEAAPEMGEEQPEETTEVGLKPDAVATEDIEMTEPNAIPSKEPTAQEQQDEVEGDNFDEGLQKNSLDQQRWSAPPIEEAVEWPASGAAS